MTASTTTGAVRPAAVHHVGVTVADLETSVVFWEQLLGVPPLWRGDLKGSHLPAITGYPGVWVAVAWLPLPGDVVLELVQYHLDDAALLAPTDRGTARPGNVHVALRTDDIDALWARALGLGARLVSDHVVTITAGPNTGMRTGYLRDPDGVTVELLQPAALDRADG